MKSFYNEHPDGITNKDYAPFINLFRNEINQSPDALLRSTADYFINTNSIQGNLTILTRAKDTLQKSGKLEEFKKICDNNLTNCFYFSNQGDFSKSNFNSAYNYSVLFSKEALFNSHELDFIKIISLLTTPKAFPNPESISISAKLLEKFYEYQTNPLEIDFNSYTTIASTFGFHQTTHSALGTICIESIKVHLNFDVVCCFIRCISRSLIGLFDDETISSLFLNEQDETSANQSKLHKFLIESLPYHCFLLLLSVFIKKFPKQANTLVHFIEKILGDDSSPMERCFGYSAISRIVPFIDQPIEFSINIIKYLLRDYDSQNPILPSLLENLYKAAIKKCKLLNLQEQLYQNLYESIKNLSWHSMVKLMIIPDIIHSFPDLFIDLLDFAQDPSDYGFVTRCVKTIAKSSPKQTSEDLLNVIIKSALKSSMYNDLMTYRPILEPLYFLLPDIINKAFEMFNGISNGSSYNDSIEVIISIWLRFESLLTLPRSKWPVKLFNLRGDLEYSIHSGNWDLRCSSLSIFTKCFNIDKIPLNFILNLRTLMFTDSPKHIFLTEDSFNVFIELLRPQKSIINNNNNDENNQEFDVDKILLNLLDIFSYHMSSTFISSHRQFALTLTETLWKKYPHIFTQKHLDAIVSILYDNSLSLRFLCRDKIKNWMKEDPNKKFNLSSVPDQFLFNDTNSKQSQSTITNNDELLKKLINEITNNNFESLKELETLINDNRSTSRPIFSNGVLDEQTEKYFNFYIVTKNVGISYRSQTVFVLLCNLLDPKLLSTKLQSWESRLLSILRDFDMESMRRSASLPDVALSLIRLQPPELTINDENDLSSQMTITTALIDLTKRTNIETEAVNSLNVLRAILKDKVMSKLDDFLYPLIFESIFVTSMKFEGWDFVAASNLCFATVFHKIFKRSDSTINLRQFFQKVPKARDLVIEGLHSKIGHANYLALTIITSFRKTSFSDGSLLEHVIPFISSKSSRMRRAAAVAACLVSPRGERKRLADQCLHYLSVSRFARQGGGFGPNGYFELAAGHEDDSNTFHGLVLVVREILGREGGRSLIGSLPPIELDKVAPMVLDDLSSVYKMMNATGAMADAYSFNFGRFYFDQVSSIVCVGKVPPCVEALSDSELVALLTKVGDGRAIEGLDRVIVTRLEKGSFSPLIFNLSVRYLRMAMNLSGSSVSYLSGVGFDPSFYLSDQIDPEMQTPLIDMLFGIEKVRPFVPLFVSIAFSKDDSVTPTKSAVAAKLPLLMEASPDGLVVALALLIDDVPSIRTKAAAAVSGFLGSQFLMEVELFDLLVAKMDERQLRLVALKWIELIEAKSECDPNGESISTLVDEFFVVRKALRALKCGNCQISKCQFAPISEGRAKLVDDAKRFFL